MLRVLSAFLLMFWLHAMVVQRIGLAQVFGIAALALFTVDFLMAVFARTPDVSKSAKQTRSLM
jgi:hypothetical protein